MRQRFLEVALMKDFAALAQESCYLISSGQRLAVLVTLWINGHR
jgi:hypothetical protein